MGEAIEDAVHLLRDSLERINQKISTSQSALPLIVYVRLNCI